MTKRTREILDLLDKQYGTEYVCYLNHENPGQLLIATILSAQCTDARVNIVTKDLFVKYPDMEAFAKADLAELEQDIKPTGFYHNKAKNIIGCAKAICEKHGGQAAGDPGGADGSSGCRAQDGQRPSGAIFTMIRALLWTLHVKRISRRLGLTAETDPEKVEYDLMKVLPKDHWILYNIQIITFGRQICFARGPKCENCFLKEYCLEYQERKG